MMTKIAGFASLAGALATGIVAALSSGGTAAATGLVTVALVGAGGYLLQRAFGSGDNKPA